jgi:hypothetical protein
MAHCISPSPRMGTIGWLAQFRQEIQALDYELHASLRILAGGEMDSEHMEAFIAAVNRRDRLMARVMSYCGQVLRSKTDQRLLNLLSKGKSFELSKPVASHGEAPSAGSELEGLGRESFEGVAQDQRTS